MDANTIGVVPGRFQEPDLHEGHRYLIAEACKHHERIFIPIGVPRGYLTTRDPLPYDMRKQMIASAFPSRSFTFAPLERDRRAYEDRSQKLDALIEREFPGSPAIIYGSRDSVIHKYAGRFTTCEVETIFESSSTELRAKVGPIDDPLFRAGYTHCINTLPRLTFPTVDLAIVDRPSKRVLLIGKEHEDTLRFCGGFFDLEYDDSLEAAAAREGGEEILDVVFTPPRIAGSQVIDDWRYRDSKHRILTTLLISDYVCGEPRPGDDAERVGWLSYEQLHQHEVMPEHVVLAELLLNHLRP